jgi:hypothetical protein
MYQQSHGLRQLLVMHLRQYKNQTKAIKPPEKYT